MVDEQVAAAGSRPRRRSSGAGGSFTATRSYPRSSAATTCARAAQVTGSSGAAWSTAPFDGVNRDHYFPRMTAENLSGRAPGRFFFCERSSLRRTHLGASSRVSPAFSADKRVRAISHIHHVPAAIKPLPT